MKNKIWIYLIAVVLMVATYFGLKNNVKKEQTDEMNLTTEEAIVNAPNKTVNYKGNYYELMLEKSKTKMNNKEYIMYKGWAKQLNIYDDYITMSIEYWDDNAINDKTGENYDDVVYAGITAELSNLFVIDNGNEKLATDNDIARLKNNIYINFTAICHEETAEEVKSVGWLGRVAKACSVGPEQIACEKIIFNSALKGERVNFKIDQFGDKRLYEILPALNQNMNVVRFQSIIDEELFVKEIIPIDVIDNKETWIKINNFNDKVLAIKNIRYWSKDYYLVNDYDVYGTTICSIFNEFCFISVDKIVMNLKLGLDSNNNIGLENFQYQSYVKDKEEDLVLIDGQQVVKGEYGRKDRILLIAPDETHIDITEFIEENNYLREKVAEFKEDYGSEDVIRITPNDSYSIKAFGDLRCGSINDLIRNGDLSCVLEPQDFSLQMAK